LQGFDSQAFAGLGTLQKKSCLKTYGRFFVFGELCHNCAMINVNTIANGNKNAAPSDATATSTPSSGSVQPARPSYYRSRVGKIARLPLAVRQEVNRRLQDNQPGVKLLAWLTKTDQGGARGRILEMGR